VRTSVYLPIVVFLIVRSLLFPPRLIYFSAMTSFSIDLQRQSHAVERTKETQLKWEGGRQGGKGNTSGGEMKGGGKAGALFVYGGGQMGGRTSNEA